MRYNEDTIIEELLTYVNKTYSEHYVKGDGEKQGIVQYLDTIFQKGNNRGTYFCVDTAGKYLNRYGEKAGHNRKDLLKALHYIVLAVYNHDKDNGVPDDEEGDYIEWVDEEEFVTDNEDAVTPLPDEESHKIADKYREIFEQIKKINPPPYQPSPYDIWPDIGKTGYPPMPKIWYSNNVWNPEDILVGDDNSTVIYTDMEMTKEDIISRINEAFKTKK